MSITTSNLLAPIDSLCKVLLSEFNLIPEKRKAQLLKLGDYISQKIAQNETPRLVVICTHNSRRSHIGQIWLAVGADYFQLPQMDTFSGGTEATAFNIRAVNALQRVGFSIVSQHNNENPIYPIIWKGAMDAYPAFSKKYDSDPNPKDKFGAILVCTEADKGCPMVYGCDFRLSLPYDDPKAFDDTELEAEKYSERVNQIGREILFSLSKVKQS